VPRTITDAQVEDVVITTLETPPDATHGSKRALARRVGLSARAEAKSCFMR
jgi:hypothetical protein